MGVVWEERGAKEDGDVVVTGVEAVGEGRSPLDLALRRFGGMLTVCLDWCCHSC